MWEVSSSLYISLSLTGGWAAHNCHLLMDFLYFLLMKHLYAVLLLKVPVTLHFPFWCVGACPSKSNIVSRVKCLHTILLLLFITLMHPGPAHCGDTPPPHCGGNEGAQSRDTDLTYLAHLSLSWPSSHQPQQSRRGSLVVPRPEMKVSCRA